MKHEPKGRLDVRRHILDVGPVSPKPNHPEDRYQRQRGDQAADTRVTLSDVRYDRDQDAGERRLKCEIPHRARMALGPNVRNGSKADTTLMSAMGGKRTPPDQFRQSKAVKLP
jgi:hypothetical protein